MTISREQAIAASLLTTLALSAVDVSAQVPGLPVLQNAFSNPGLTFAANFGAGDGQSFYGAAAAWGFGSTGAITISGAAGSQNANDASRGAYGGRLIARIWSSRGSGLGLAAFAGVGGAPRTREDLVLTNPAELLIPAGVSVGYRRPLGSSRGFAAYATPFYRWSRTDRGMVETSSSAFRVSAGLDLSVSATVGVTAGGEFGGSSGDGGHESGAFGAAVSFVLGGGR